MSGRVVNSAGAACGAAYVALLFGLSGAGDSSGALAAEVIALVLFLPFLGCLWGVLRTAEGGTGWLSLTAFGAGVVALAIKMGSVGAGYVARQGDVGPGLRDAFDQANSVAFIATMVPLAVFMAAVAVVILASGVLPRWLGWLAAISAPLLLANSTALGSEEAPAFLLYLLWTLLVSVVMVRRAAGEESRAVAEPRLT